jgi:hypothetical protein
LDAIIPQQKIAPVASGPLIEGLREFIFSA